MKLKILFSFMFLLLANGFAQNTYTINKSDFPHKFDPSRNPENDLKAAIITAQKTNKRILLDIGGEWCIWCRKLDKFFEDNEVIHKYLKENFVVLKVNFSPENENKKFLSRFPKAAGYPHFFVLEKNGKFLHSQNTGELEEKDHHDYKKMFDFLKKWAPKNS